MPNLVPVPWQPSLYLTPHTLAYFERANAALGETLFFNGSDSCFRLYSTQKYLYDGYVNRLPGFNTASNPDTGQRSHMRGAAGDLIRTDQAAQNACRSVGLIRDAYESWHWNDPNWSNMPIITNPEFASLDSTPIGGFLMALTDQEQVDLKNKVDQISNAIFVGGPSMLDNQKSISWSLAQIRGYLSQQVTGRDRGDGKGKVNVSQIQDNADTNTIVRNIQAKIDALVVGGVDPAIIEDAVNKAVINAIQHIIITTK